MCGQNNNRGYLWTTSDDKNYLKVTCTVTNILLHSSAKAGREDSSLDNSSDDEGRDQTQKIPLAK